MTFSFFSTHLRYSLILNFNRWNQPIRMHKISFTKIKAISQSLYKSYQFATLLQKLDCSILQRLEHESRFPFSKKYFIFLKKFLNSSQGIWQGQLTGKGVERGQFTGENSACTIITNKKLLTQKCYGLPHDVWLGLLLFPYYTVIKLFPMVFTSVNKSTRWKKNYLN